MRILVYSTCQEEWEIEQECGRKTGEEIMRSGDLPPSCPQSSPPCSPWLVRLVNRAGCGVPIASFLEVRIHSVYSGLIVLCLYKIPCMC